jgi:RNA polymerase sigma factor (sigma-70 family)
LTPTVRPDTPSAQDAASLARTAFTRHYAELHRFLLRRLARPQDAADLMQEIFLRILRVERSELVRKPMAYVYGIASHVVYEFRLRGRQERVTFDSEIVEQTAEHPPQVSGDELLERLISERQVEQALRQLSPTHQAVLILHKRDGLSREEVAQHLGLSVHTVKKYVCQAMALLRANWVE